MPSPKPLPQSLHESLTRILPGACLETIALATSPAIQLQLLNADYPQEDLTQEEVQQVMNNPLYWVFCWASGQVLAEFLLDNPHWVNGKRVVDFGCGCGVVAIAAALAGAAEVIACDIDQLALQATRINAALNGVDLMVTDDYFQIEDDVDLIIVADVLYDRSNYVWLERFFARAHSVLIADSRVKNFDFPHYRPIARQPGSTLPDLDESPEFRDVRIYLANSTGELTAPGFTSEVISICR